jgi:hypothetical protein
MYCEDNIQSARLAGFGGSGSAVELFVQETEFAKVNPVIEFEVFKIHNDLNQ